MIEPSYVFVNGSVITVDARNRVVSALAVAGRRILALGDDQQISDLIGPGTEVIDLAGRSLLPGFIDAHCHPTTYGAATMQLICTPDRISSIEDLKSAVRTRAAETPAGEWIIGRGYIDTELLEKRHPTREDLDQAAPDHPVIIVRTCGHIGVINSLALAKAGISVASTNPVGGRIERDSSGRPNGILYEQALFTVRDLAQPGDAAMKQAVRKMNDDFLACGLTSVTDASGRHARDVAIYQDGLAEGWLKVRVRLMVQEAPPATTLGGVFLETGLRTGFGNDKLSIGPWKTMLDGAGGGASAAMKDGYPADPDNHGILYYEQDQLDAMVLKAHRAGYQIGIHAIGDTAVEMTIRAYKEALAKCPRRDHRHRIEHCGFLSPASLNDIAEMGIIPALGASFLYRLGDNYLDVFGPKRLSLAYPVKSLLDRGIPAALTSDAPVIRPDPLEGIYLAVARRTKKGRSIVAEQAVSIHQAIRAYTYHGAYAGFDEHIKGSLEPGKLADLIILSGDILAARPEDLLDLKVELTMIDGKKVFPA